MEPQWILRHHMRVRRFVTVSGCCGCPAHLCHLVWACDEMLGLGPLRPTWPWRFHQHWGRCTWDSWHKLTICWTFFLAGSNWEHTRKIKKTKWSNLLCVFSNIVSALAALSSLETLAFWACASLLRPLNQVHLVIGLTSCFYLHAKDGEFECHWFWFAAVYRHCCWWFSYLCAERRFWFWPGHCGHLLRVRSLWPIGWWNLSGHWEQPRWEASQFFTSVFLFICETNIHVLYKHFKQYLTHWTVLFIYSWKGKLPSWFPWKPYHISFHNEQSLYPFSG